MEPGEHPQATMEDARLKFANAELTWTQICCQAWETAYYAAQAQIVQLNARVAYLELVIAERTQLPPETFQG